MSDGDQVERILEQIADEADRRWLVDRLAAPSLRRARRLARRDGLIRQLGLQYQGFSSVRALVAVIETALRRYLAAGFRFERSLPAAPAGARGLLWEILSENQGRPLSGSTIRDALAGIARKSNRKMYTGAPIPRRFGSKSGTKRDARSREKATADKGR